MDVGSIMSPLPVSIGPQARLDEATELMDSHGIRHLPVIEAGRLVGVVGDRDLFELTGWRPARNGNPPERVSNEHRARPLADVMHPPGRRLSPEDPLVAAAQGIAQQRVGCLAVEREGVLIGIVTEVDVLRAYADAVDAGRIAAGDDPLVSDLMTCEVATIEGDATLGEAIERCAAEAVHHLPVLAGGGLIGVLSDRDLARAVGRGTPIGAPVREWMSTDPLTIAADDPASVAAARMSDERVGALPVLAGGTLVGLLSVTDLLDHAQDVLGD